MHKHFESNKKVTAIPDESDALIQFHNRPYISYQEINLTQNFDIYFSRVLSAESASRMDVINSPYQQMFEINKDTQSITVTFKGVKRQFEWMEISLVYDKSYQYQTAYDRYDVDLAAQFIQTPKLDNASSTNCVTGKLEYNVKNEDEKDWLYRMFIAYNCNSCSTAPLTQYKNNEIYQEITEKDEFTESNKGDRTYIDMRRSHFYTDKLEKLARDDSGLALTINLKEATKKE